MRNSPSIAKTCIVEFENWWNTNLVLLRMSGGGTSIATFTPRGSSTQLHSHKIIISIFTFSIIFNTVIILFIFIIIIICSYIITVILYIFNKTTIIIIVIVFSFYKIIIIIHITIFTLTTLNLSFSFLTFISYFLTSFISSLKLTFITFFIQHHLQLYQLN